MKCFTTQFEYLQICENLLNNGFDESMRYSLCYIKIEHVENSHEEGKIFKGYHKWYGVQWIPVVYIEIHRC